MERDQGVKRLDGPSLKALAHPLRMRLLAALRNDGPATATTLGRRLGENSGATSYHLRVLADHGFVTEDRERGNGRDRWWRAAHDMTSWRSSDFLDDPETRAADEWLLGTMARKAADSIDAYIARRSGNDPAWIAASDASDYALHMTPERLRALTEEVHAVINRHKAAADAADDPEAERVFLLLWAFPEPEPQP